MKVRSLGEIPARATIVDEFTKCGRPDCAKKHGPYKYAYWKENGRLKKVYIGKSMNDLKIRLHYQKMQADTGESFSELRKQEKIAAFARSGAPMAIQGLEKIQLGLWSLDWAYRKLREHYTRPAPDIL